jgi:hypothetical protein
MDGMAVRPGVCLELARANLGRGPAYALMTREGETLAVGGLVLAWPGVAEAWLAPNPEAAGHGLSLVRECRSWMEMLRKSLGLVRIQIHVRATDKEALRFARLLGFEREGYCRKFTPDGRDAVRLARIF